MPEGAEDAWEPLHWLPGDEVMKPVCGCCCPYRVRIVMTVIEGCYPASCDILVTMRRGYNLTNVPDEYVYDRENGIVRVFPENPDGPVTTWSYGCAARPTQCLLYRENFNEGGDCIRIDDVRYEGPSSNDEHDYTYYVDVRIVQTLAVTLCLPDNCPSTLFCCSPLDSYTIPTTVTWPGGSYDYDSEITVNRVSQLCYEGVDNKIPVPEGSQATVSFDFSKFNGCWRLTNPTKNVDAWCGLAMVDLYPSCCTEWVTAQFFVDSSKCSDVMVPDPAGDPTPLADAITYILSHNNPTFITKDGNGHSMDQNLLVDYAWCGSDCNAVYESFDHLELSFGAWVYPQQISSHLCSGDFGCAEDGHSGVSLEMYIDPSLYPVPLHIEITTSSPTGCTPYEYVRSATIDIDFVKFDPVSGESVVTTYSVGLTFTCVGGNGYYAGDTTFNPCKDGVEFYGNGCADVSDTEGRHLGLLHFSLDPTYRLDGNGYFLVYGSATFSPGEHCPG